ncbi:GNAT family N-acetyltransferase [Parabacteroides bouchesdurhonensis]|uniref:GNAT family N-acetyltransferase n=1 Tax=Parabacteroides bouchesdurhonensis TaxID=1936995 RepID=UPI000E5324BB|nr:GNAT family N-acetyltransferase [Parabacteroides bouchesdurhonensis]RHJ93034.1 GNAT family N-acetyltransferase [Bacteroides sp. AM07-16]
MQLTHIALWTNDLEHLRDFYVKYFDGISNEKYVNPKKGFASYFVSFESGPSLEIMQRQDVTEIYGREHIGLAHMAFHAATREIVNQKIEQFRMDGYTIAGEPRVSGDGYYEGVVLDPDGNRIEIVAYGEVEITRALFFPYGLLLLADPDKEKVDAYLPASDCFVATAGQNIVGVIVVQKQGNDVAEIKNLAVSETYQRRGIARKLLRYVSEKWASANGVKRLKICTGTSAVAPLMLYQQEGFDLMAIDRDYFVREYSEPIWENDIQCRHQLILEKIL